MVATETRQCAYYNGAAMDTLGTEIVIEEKQCPRCAGTTFEEDPDPIDAPATMVKVPSILPPALIH